jgi:hypothetical protein
MSRKSPFGFGEFSDLDGMPKRVRGVHCTSVTDAIRKIRRYRCVAAAGGNGALTIWRNRNGLQCEFDRYLAPLSRVSPPTIKALREWLKVWWPAMGR